MSKFGDTERKIKDLFLQVKNFSYVFITIEQPKLIRNIRV